MAFVFWRWVFFVCFDFWVGVLAFFLGLGFWGVELKPRNLKTIRKSTVDNLIADRQSNRQSSFGIRQFNRQSAVCSRQSAGRQD
jgi:hypothetical protein